MSEGERVLRPERRSGNLLLAHKQCTVVHEPLGVVAACVSWNYPVHNMLGPVISALFAGNAIVVKCSEQVAWTSQHMLNGVCRCLDACGAPSDLVQVVACGPASVEALTRDPRLAHITFIGSDAVGRLVAAAAAPQLTATTLELGGKDPAVLLPGTSISFFASMCTSLRSHPPQSCARASRAWARIASASSASSCTTTRWTRWSTPCSRASRRCAAAASWTRHASASRRSPRTASTAAR